MIPGQTIGWVGSSGYGSPGTQGKFPPHLHYGIYRDRGITEWAFDPYPLLKQWENQEFRQLKKTKIRSEPLLHADLHLMQHQAAKRLNLHKHPLIGADGESAQQINQHSFVRAVIA